MTLQNPIAVMRFMAKKKKSAAFHASQRGMEAGAGELFLNVVIYTVFSVILQRLKARARRRSSKCVIFHLSPFFPPRAAFLFICHTYLFGRAAGAC